MDQVLNCGPFFLLLLWLVQEKVKYPVVLYEKGRGGLHILEKNGNARLTHFTALNKVFVQNLLLRALQFYCTLLIHFLNVDIKRLYRNCISTLKMFLWDSM